MLYFAGPADGFALVNHPAQPTLHALHVWLAPLLVFLVGVLWKRHIWARVRSGFRPRRPSGLALTASFFPMVASAYFLQTAVDERWGGIWLWMHLIASGLWILAYGVHQVSRRSA